MNTITGAWCQWTGINANCWEVLNDVPYFGSNDGIVYQADYGSGDYVGSLDLPITATVQTAFNYFESRGHLKRWTMVRPILTTDGSVVPGIGLNIDFGTGAPISVPTATRRRIFERDKWTCVSCGSKTELVLDHIVPIDAGGGNEDIAVAV